MNLRSLDLNLLLVFDAIYGENSISKAARKLHLSQRDADLIIVSKWRGCANACRTPCSSAALAA